jgi:DNA-binding transcriptional regulator YiaG
MKTKLYHYLESGLRNIWLANGFTVHETEYGNALSIDDVTGLHRVIAKRLIENKPHLTGSEFRFLRKELGLSQAKLGELWGYDAQTVALWEKRGRVPVIADRFIRIYYREVAEGNAKIVEMIEHLKDMDLREDSRLVFEEKRGRWQAKAA